MSQPHTEKAIAVPIPTGGMNWVDPLASMEPIYSPWLLNVEMEPRYIRARGTYREHVDLSTEASGVNPFTLGKHGSELFCYLNAATGNHTIYEISTGTATLVHTTGSSSSLQAYPVHHAGHLYFVTNNNLAPQSSNRYYDGSTWSSWGYTYGGTTQPGNVAVSFKGRMYFFYALQGYFSGLGQLTGEVEGEWNLADIFESDADIAFANIVSSASNVADDQYLVIGNLDGEILVYGGNYPGSSNWQLVARFKTSPVMNFNCTLAYNNDLWVPTAYGVVSIRKLFQGGGSQTRDITVSAPIDPFWQKHTLNLSGGLGNYSSSRCSIAFLPRENKVYIAMRGTTQKDLDYDGADYTVFVFNGYTGAWCVHHLDADANDSLGNLMELNGVLYLGTGEYVTYYDDDFFNPDTVNNNSGSVEWYIEGAYMNFGSPMRHKMLKQFEPIMKTTLGGSQIDGIAAADFGRAVSVKTSNTFAAGADDFKNPHYKAGIEGNYLQWRMNGTIAGTSGTAFELYGMSMVVV